MKDVPQQPVDLPSGMSLFELHERDSAKSEIIFKELLRESGKEIAETSRVWQQALPVIREVVEAYVVHPVNMWTSHDERRARISELLGAGTDWLHELADGEQYRAGLDTPSMDGLITGFDLSLTGVEGVPAATADALSETDDRAVRTTFKAFAYIFGPTPIGPINDLTKELGKAVACSRLKRLEGRVVAALESLRACSPPER
jgi:hypothetical protein